MKSLADLCDLYEDRVQVIAPIFRHFGGKKRFFGQVTTLRVRDDNSLVRQTLEQEGLGRVLVVDGGGSLNCALLGDRLAELAINNGWSGIVINGCIRDSKEILSMPVGVMARATHPRRSKKNGLGESQIAIQIEGLEIRPKQFLYADEDGLLVSNEALK